MNNDVRKYLELESNVETRNSPNGLYRHMNHYHWSSQVLDSGIEGDFVELGCWKGGTSKLLGLVMQWKNSDKELHLYDSFNGIPELTEEDFPKYGKSKFFIKGAFPSRMDYVVKNMYPIPFHVHPGWFSETCPEQLPDKICYAHLDGDLYSSIKESLEYVYPRLVSGAICVVDDYNHCELPGVEQAVSEFMADKPEEFYGMNLNAVGLNGVTIQGFFRKL